ncbi:MAG: SprB repeat-containing protein, partial [Flavobacteriales bacterium]|nr:SprB repeat-containing protein [Flavobacteriales bacterium]
DVLVNPLPSVSFSGLDPAYCVDAGTTTLAGFPSGGTFTGAGISGNIFDPGVAGEGTFAITYVYSDGNGCTDSLAQNVTVDPLPVVTYAGLNPTYCVSAGSSPLTGSPAGGSFSGVGISGSTFFPAVAGIGSYTITYTYSDGNGCTGSRVKTVIVTALPATSFTGLAATYCAGNNPDLLTGVPLGGIFSGPGVVGSSFDPAVAGIGVHTIQYMYTDGGGCADSTTQTTEVKPNSPFLSVDSVTTTEAACDSTCDAMAEVIGSGGVAPYSYLWSNGDVGVMADTLCASTFFITVTDANGCTADNDIIVAGPNGFISSITDTTMVVGCFGACNATAEVTGNGGVPPYTYKWVDSGGSPLPGSSPTIAGLCAGSYFAVVKDASTCVTTAPFTITEPGSLTPNICATQNVSCNFACDGSATVCFTGGTAPITYLWNDFASQTTATATNLCAGTYRVTLTDVQGCITVDSNVVITEPSVVIVAIGNMVQANCDTLAPIGSATAQVSGGIGPYQYLWNTTPQQTDSVADGQLAGLYNVTVTDQNGCTDTSSVNITDTSSMAASITALTLTSCGGACDGSATVTPTGSTVPYVYAWGDSFGVSIGETDSLADSLCAGLYRVTVTSSVFCIRSVPANTITPLPVVGFAGLSPSHCISGIAEVLGGTPVGGTFSGPGISGSTFDPGVAGAGTHVIKYVYDDGFGCVDSSMQATVVNGDPAVSFTGLDTGYCVDGSGSALVGVPSGGTFSGPGMSATVFTPSSAGAGTHTVKYIYTTNQGCTDSAFGSVNVNALPTPGITGLDPVYCLAAAGAVLVGSPVGGTFSGGGISGNTFFPAFADTGSHVITYSYTAGSSCSNSLTQSTIVVPMPVASFTGLAPGYCASNPAAPLIGTPAGGTFSGPGIIGNSFDPATAGVGTHNIMYLYSDGNNCSDSSFQTVVVNTDSPFLSVDSVMTTVAACDSTCNAIAEVIGSGGVVPYSYLWSNGDVGTVAVSLCASTFYVTVTDANGCTADNDIIVAGPNGFISSITDTTMVTGCFGACNGTAEVTGNGGVPPYTYNWVDTSNSPLGSTASTVASLCAGSYYAVVKDASNCVTTAPFTITEPGLLTPTICNTQNASCNATCDGSATACLT